MPHSSLSYEEFQNRSRPRIKIDENSLGYWMYEIRLVKSDGSTTLIYVTTSLADVQNVLPDMKVAKYEKAEVWLDGKCIRTEYRTH
jgi:hypothetical protein